MASVEFVFSNTKPSFVQLLFIITFHQPLFSFFVASVHLEHLLDSLIGHFIHSVLRRVCIYLH